MTYFKNILTGLLIVLVAVLLPALLALGVTTCVLLTVIAWLWLVTASFVNLGKTFFGRGLLF